MPRASIPGTLAVALVAMVVAGCAQFRIASSPWGLGVSAGGPNGVGDHEAWLGRDVTMVSSFLSRRTWGELTGSVADAAGRWEGHDVHLVLGVPLLPVDGSSDLADVAAGDHDDDFRAVARELVAQGEPDAVIRLGWEMDATWYPWSGWDDPDAFVGAWRRVVAVMRQVRGARFTFDWNSANEGTDPTPLYPGDDVVDIVGLDLYDQSFDDDLADPAARWADLRSRPGGLDWLVEFSTTHDKPMSLPEWGLSTRHVDGAEPDNADFVRQVHAFITEHDVLYYVYFDHDTYEGSFSLRSGNFPRAAAVYRELFGTAGA